MPSYLICGIGVDFPKNAYECQLTFMKQVILALQSKQNALLESPTGTGKTLCLLCAVLSYQNMIKAKLLSQNPKGKQNYPVVIYASRTHTQLSQVVGELKSTSFRTKMVVLGSRDQLCVNPRLSHQKGNVLNNSCAALCAERKCMYRNNLDHYHGAAEGSNGAPAPIMDIEDLVATGKKDKICGYYYSREELSTSDLILLPYNYLLDPVVRSTVNVDWTNTIVIFDEAHNLEKSACDAASVTITSGVIAAIIKELQDTLRILQSASSEGGSSKSNESGLSVTGSTTLKLIKPSLDSVVNILKSVFELENRIDSIPLRIEDQFGGVKACALAGSWLSDTLESVGFRFERVCLLQLLYEVFCNCCEIYV